LLRLPPKHAAAKMPPLLDRRLHRRYFTPRPRRRAEDKSAAADAPRQMAS